MNGDEQITLTQVHKQLTDHVEVSKQEAAAVATFMKKVEPILKEYHDKIAVRAYLRGRWKVVVGILTVLAFIGSITVATLNIFRGN